MNRSLCVIVADDQPEERARIVTPLRSHGITVHEVEDGLQAVEDVKAGGVDLVLLDAYMPRMNGFLAVKTIRETRRDQAPPMLLLIPNASPKEIALAAKLGSSGHLPKPVDLTALLERVWSLTSAAPAAGLATLVSKPALTLTESRAREEIVRRIEQIPSLPTIVHELVQKVGDESSHVADLEAVICRDQGLAARVLKLVNSSFFRGQREINSIGDAVVRLGRNTLQSLALASSVSPAFSVDCRTYGYLPGGLWLHSFAVGTAARQIAARVAAGDAVERAFLGGLLHDVGKLVLGVMIEKRREEFVLAMAEAGSTSEAEKRVFFHTHPEIGDMVGERWKFPPALREIIRTHHRALPADGGDPALMSVMLADRMCTRLGLGRIPAPADAAASSATPAATAVPAPPPDLSGTAAPGPDGEASLPVPAPDELPFLERLGVEPEALAAIEATTRETAEVFEVHLAA